MLLIPRIKKSIVAIAATITLGLVGCVGNNNPSAPGSSPVTTATAARTIIFVWDGLRPDSINQTETPNLFALRASGVAFADNHSTYPTFTMMNAGAFATGSFPGASGFYGNTVYQPGASGKDAGAATIDFSRPVFTEDYGVLAALDSFYNGQLFLVGTLFKAAQDKGLKTVTIGKRGAAYIQDYKRGGLILDEDTVFPQSLVTELQSAGLALPKNTPNAYAAGAVSLSASNGDPTAQAATVSAAFPNGLRNGDPTDASGAKATADNKFMMDAYLNYILPNKKPDLTLIWFRDPDSTEHAYGPGSSNYKLALQAQDARLGDLQAKLKALGLATTTNIIVVSDHAHSSVSGPTSLFPLRAIAAGAVGNVDANGYSTSGDVRTAELLTRAGFTAYDGSGCLQSAMAGLKVDGTSVYPILIDPDGSICGMAGAKYQTKRYTVPASLPANAIVIAANGGSDYLYVPNHDAATVAKIVSFLQRRSEYGAIFLAARYGNLPGTIPMSNVKVENVAGRNPDIIVSFDYDETVTVAGLKGIEFESFQNNRGMHGSFSPIDVHNTLVVNGPSFKSGVTDSNPSGNVDVAPTLAFLIGTILPQADGRVLYEALKSSPAGLDAPTFTTGVVRSPGGNVSGLKFQLPTNPDGTDIDLAKGGNYSVQVGYKDLKQADGKTYRYFDFAKATRN